MRSLCLAFGRRAISSRIPEATRRFDSGNVRRETGSVFGRHYSYQMLRPEAEQSWQSDRIFVLLIAPAFCPGRRPPVYRRRSGILAIAVSTSSASQFPAADIRLGGRAIGDQGVRASDAVGGNSDDEVPNATTSKR